MESRILAIAVLTIFAGVPSAPAATIRASHSGWTLSDSATDPLGNFGPATPDTLTLYIWLYCAIPQTAGVASAHFGFDPIADNVIDIQLSPGVVDANPLWWDLDLTLQDCPLGSFLVGSCQVIPGGGVSRFTVCPTGGPDAGGEATGCGGGTAFMSWIGYHAGEGDSTCVDLDFFATGFCEPVTAVASESWGRTKALYHGGSKRSPN